MEPCVYVDTLIYVHLFTQRQKRTNQGPSEPPRSVFLSSRNRLRLEAQAWLSSSYCGKLWKPSCSRSSLNRLSHLSNASIPRGPCFGLGLRPCIIVYLSSSHRRSLCLVLGTKPLGRNPTSCRMASIDDKVLEGPLEGISAWDQ